MELNEKQKQALEGAYRTARIYTKIAAKLNEMADSVKFEAEGNTEDECMEMFVRVQANYLESVMRAYDGLNKYTNDRLNDIKEAFHKE